MIDSIEFVVRNLESQELTDGLFMKALITLNELLPQFTKPFEENLEKLIRRKLPTIATTSVTRALKQAAFDSSSPAKFHRRYIYKELLTQLFETRQAEIEQFTGASIGVFCDLFNLYARSVISDRSSVFNAFIRGFGFSFD